jgi:hypothetical protein
MDVSEGHAGPFARYNQQICAVVYDLVKRPRRPALLRTRSISLRLFVGSTETCGDVVDELLVEV